MAKKLKLVNQVKMFDPSDVELGESTSGIIHFCDLCGKRGRWNRDWAWYGSYADLDAGVILKTCGCSKPTDAEAKGLLAEKRQSMGLKPKVRLNGYNYR